MPSSVNLTIDSRTRAALEASEQRFRARFEQAGLPQAMVSLDGRLVGVNDAFCELLERSREELADATVRDLCHASDSGAGNLGIAGLLEGRQDSARWERVVTRPDGSPVPVLVHAAVLRESDGTPYGVATFVQDLTVLREAERALTRREILFEALVRQATDWALVFDAQCRVQYVSPSLTTVFGHDSADLIDRSGWDFVHPDDLSTVQAVFEAVVMRGGRSEPVVFRVPDANGCWRWVEEVFTNLLEEPAIEGVVCNGRDITSRVEVERALRASEARYRAIAETAQEGIWAVDRTGRTLYANRKVADILGVPLPTIYEQTASDLLPPNDVAVMADKLRRRHETGAQEYELSYDHPDGAVRRLRFSVSPLRDDVGPVGSLAMIDDVTDARRAEAELRRRALHDELTGLANRTLLDDRLEQAFARTVCRGAGQVAVLFVALDQFQFINDTWGHAAGDCVLKQVAERLTTTVRPGDTVARFGGDEFVIVCEDRDELHARTLANVLLATLTTPFDADGERVHVNASIGIAVSPPDSAQELQRFAAAAMHDAKSRPGTRVQVFDSALADEVADRLVLSNDLRDALVNDELSLNYQPVVELTTGRVLAFEALARWTHPTRGPVSPARFVAVAEATGLAHSLDRWAIDRACNDLGHLRSAFGHSLRVAVNISASNLTDTDLETAILAALHDRGLSGNGFTLEITETTVMENPEQARALLERLGEHGVTAAIDDFGTGYSSLGYLTQLPVATLKIDRTFVENMATDTDALAITASIIDLARTMRLTTVAEGVETTDQLSLLQRLGCSAGQGFLWSAAIPVADVGPLVKSLPYGRFDVTVAESDSARPPAAHHDPVTVQNGLQRIMALHRAGASLTTIAAALNVEGYRTPRGLRWHRTTVAKVISDIAYPNLLRPTEAS
jgi:diguanylate cyclase (GGDEF)-like protein/PAS domain S-box-containing protein